MVKAPVQHSYAILYALAGFGLWVFGDTFMKLLGETSLPPYEVVGFLGLIAALSLVAYQAPRGKMRDLWPKRPMPQIVRAVLAFGCQMSNVEALKHLPLTMFYIVVFASPMVVALMAALLLHEKLSWPKIIAIIAGFIGVVIAVDPWNHASGGDWIGYAAGASSVFFFCATTLMMRATSQTETPESMTFMSGAVEALLGFGIMLAGAVAVTPMILLVLLCMGLFNVTGNLFNSKALRGTNAATVEQFHYTQIIFGAALGYIIWHEVPTSMMIAGTALIMAAGLYVLASTHRASKMEAAKLAAAQLIP